MSKNQETIIDPETDEMETTTPTTPEHTVKTYPELKRGLKKCECGLIVGAKTKVCNCGHVFVSKGVAKSSPKTEKVEDKVVHNPTKNKLAVWSVLKGKGYELSVTLDILEKDATPVVNCQKELQPLVDLITSDEVELIQSSPSIKYAVSLEGLMSIFKLKANK